MAQYAKIVETASHDLQSDRQTVGIAAAADRGSGLFRLVEGRGRGR